MKKIIALLLIAVMTISLTACGDKHAESDSSNESGGKSVEIPNPYVDCNTLEDASGIAGFDFTVPYVIDGYNERVIRAIEGNMIEVIFSNEDNEICIRKALGSEDVSGDYNEYAEKNIIQADKLQIITRGSEGKVNVATWVNGDYTFSLSISAGMKGDSVVDFIKGIQ